MSGKLIAERVPSRGSAAVLSGKAAAGGLEVRVGSAACLPILAQSLIHWARHALLSASFFPSVSEEIE